MADESDNLPVVFPQVQRIVGSTQERIHEATIRNGSKHAKAHLEYNRSQRLTTVQYLRNPVSNGIAWVRRSGRIHRRTSSPVQNIGHLFHGVSLASPSQVLKYGLRTTKGNTGGVSFEAPTGRLSSAEPAATAETSQCIAQEEVYIVTNFG